MRFVPQDVELSMPDKLLLKALTKLLLRVETFLVCTDGMIVNPYSYQLDMIKSKLNRGKYFCDLVDSRLVAVSSAETPVLRTVDWDAFYTDMNKLLSSVETGSATVQLVLNELDNEKAFRKGEEDRVVKTEKVRRLKVRYVYVFSGKVSLNISHLAPQPAAGHARQMAQGNIPSKKV